MENYDELYHHGVKGMKWGVRKKYPINFMDTTRSGSNKPRKLDFVSTTKSGLNRPRNLDPISKTVSVIRQKQRSNAERDLLNIRTKQRVAKAEQKLAKLKIKDLERQYGELEDQMTYGKNTNTKNNSRIESQMKNIESEINKLNVKR